MAVDRRTTITVAIALLALTAVAAFVVVMLSRLPGASLTFGGSDDGDEVLRALGERDMDPAEPDVPSVVDESRVIRGQVVRPSGEPAPGVRVVVQAPGFDETQEVVTDVGGMFRFEDLPITLYAVEAAPEGFGPAIAIGVVPGGAPLRLVLQSGRTLTGRFVRGEEPVAGATVHVGGPGLYPQRIALTDGAGRFQVAGLRPGRYEIALVASGLASTFGVPVTVTDDGGSESDAGTIAALLTPSVPVRVVDRGTGETIEAGVITMATATNHVLSLSTLLDNGHATIDFLAPGEYRARVRAPGYMPWEGRLWVTPSAEEVRISLSQGATIRGRVVDEAGNPISGARLRAIVETSSGGRFELTSGVFEVFHRMARPDGTAFWWPSSDYSTRADGSFELSGLPGGIAAVVATRAGFAEGASRQLTIMENRTYDDIVVTLSRGRALRGQVRTSTGTPVSNASVAVAPLSVPAWVGGRNVMTDRLGQFTFRDLPRRVRLTVRHPDYPVVTEELEIDENGLDGHIVELEAADRLRLTGRVLTTQRGPAQGARALALRGDSDVPVCQGFTDARGHFTTDACTSRPERLVIHAPGYAPLVEELGGRFEARDRVLRAGGEIAVVAQRNPVRATVQPRFQLPADAWPRPTVELDRWNREIVQLVAPGDYRVVCRTDGHQDANVDVTVAEGHRAEAVCPVASRTMELGIVAVDAMGARVSNAVVFVEGPNISRQLITDAEGRVQLEGDPGTWVSVEAVHERWGRGTSGAQIPRERAEPTRVVLNEPIGGSATGPFLALLADWGIDGVLDGRSVIVRELQSGTPASGVGLRRRDLMLWARPIGAARLSVGVRRGDDLLVFELIRENR